MKRIIKKVLSIVLTIAMLVSITPVFASTVSVGDNGKTILFGFDFYDEVGQPASYFEAGDNFSMHIKFSGNPSVASESMQGYTLVIGYDPDKIAFPYSDDETCLGVLNTPSMFKSAFITGVMSVTGLANGGIKQGRDIVTEGTVFTMDLQAKEDISEADLKAISLIEYATDGTNIQETLVIDGAARKFTVVQAPAISVGEVEGNIYTSTSADDIKDAIASFSFIDNSGTETTYTSEDAEWEDLEILLPQSGLVEGKNTLTASYDGYTCSFDVTVAIDAVNSIAITTEPDKTTYTAFDKFDKTGMVVTATYDSGKTKDVTEDCVVDITTLLEVADTEWTIAYDGKTAKQAITVNPLEIEKPVASGEVLTYTGGVQEFEYFGANEEYISVTGETSGKAAKEYSALAVLKDKSNTVWEDGTTDSVRLYWTIQKASITSGIGAMTKKYTTTYAELPSEADMVGVNSESVSASISWYTDDTYETVAADETQIAESYEGESQTVTLYYKATGLSNYEDYEGIVIVSVTDKDAGTIEWKTLPEGLSKTGANVEGLGGADQWGN
ncbi:MAG: hypothetical protein IKB93_16210, partial [Clostridia bacterium]|nr:hypothetical protein [Clostridia bacterium]